MKSQLLVNIASLFSIRVAGYIIPLITLPYLIKTLGVSSYGNLALGLAIVQYFQLIVNFGFDLSATERISKMREDIIVVSRIYWSVIFFRIIMTIIGFFVLFIISTYSEVLHSIDRILYFSYLTVLGVAIFPQWLFQG
ncbi:oligosaccharide flippase family protein, partial [Vibrio hyugaensis]|uniref:oligosaccharide flippase family protein n=1 Tax=Vibrio hyugaensis TaxID=1534743 RepID=UPI0015E28EDA